MGRDCGGIMEGRDWGGIVEGRDWGRDGGGDKCGSKGEICEDV